MKKPVSPRENLSRNTLLLPQNDVIIENYLQNYLKVFSQLNMQIKDLKSRVDKLVAE